MPTRPSQSSQRAAKNHKGFVPNAAPHMASVSVPDVVLGAFNEFQSKSWENYNF